LFDNEICKFCGKRVINSSLNLISVQPKEKLFFPSFAKQADTRSYQLRNIFLTTRIHNKPSHSLQLQIAAERSNISFSRVKDSKHSWISSRKKSVYTFYRAWKITLAYLELPRKSWGDEFRVLSDAIITGISLSSST
jgi:hypothetical protein